MRRSIHEICVEAAQTIYNSVKDSGGCDHAAGVCHCQAMRLCVELRDLAVEYEDEMVKP